MQVYAEASHYKMETFFNNQTQFCLEKYKIEFCCYNILFSPLFFLNGQFYGVSPNTRVLFKYIFVNIVVAVGERRDIYTQSICLLVQDYPQEFILWFNFTLHCGLYFSFNKRLLYFKLEILLNAYSVLLKKEHQC